MEYQAKPRLRIGRVILGLTMALLLMCVGYVAGNFLEKYLKKKMAEKQNKDAPQEIESHEDEDGTDWEELFKDKEDVAVEKEEATMGFQLTEEVEEKKEAKMLPLKETKKFTKKAPKPQK